MTDRPTSPVPSRAQLAQIYQQALACHQQGMLSEAEAGYKSVLRIVPNDPPSLHNLGAIRLQQGRIEEAAKLLRKSLAAAPHSAEAHNNLGMALQALRRPKEAVAHFDQALALKPDFAEAHNNVANLHMRLGDGDAARVHFERALAIRPRYAEAHSNLAVLLLERREGDAALYHSATAQKLDPDSSEIRASYGNLLLSFGRADEARAQFEKAIALNPHNPVFHSNLLLCLNYLAEVTAESLSAAHRDWAIRHAPVPASPDRRFPRRRGTHRRLRVGYVSPDFYGHSVAFFFEPLLAAHDRQQFEIICFADVTTPDATTARFAAAADKWVDIVGMSDEAVAQRIRAASIDILVDLTGHTGRHRLGVFARKPAPVQFTWLGYPNTTGLAAIDYRITDAIADPPGAADALHAEELVRLPRCFVCYGAPGHGGPVADVPAASARPVTFGSFNNLAKATPQVIALWARVLQAVPDARILVKALALLSAGTRALVLERFAACGIAADRVIIAEWTPGAPEHLALYGEIDIALDTFPYNGTTTTCEALWMGVPVVTLAGDRHAARVGASLLAAAGLPELVATSADEFVAIAVELAQDRTRRAALRSGLREQMRQSELCDAAGFARAIEAAFHTAWQRWRDAAQKSA